MVPNDSPVFLSLADGSVIGKPQPGQAGKRADIRSTSGSAARERVGKLTTADPVAGASLTTGPVEVAKPKPNRAPRQQQSQSGQRQSGQDRSGRGTGERQQ
jgi:hypothetical protein